MEILKVYVRKVKPRHGKALYQLLVHRAGVSLFADPSTAFGGIVYLLHPLLVAAISGVKEEKSYQLLNGVEDEESRSLSRKFLINPPGKKLPLAPKEVKILQDFLVEFSLHN